MQYGWRQMEISRDARKEDEMSGHYASDVEGDEMSELKPCPFCGADKWGDTVIGQTIKAKRCEVCGATIPIEVVNIRPLEDALQATIDALRQELAFERKR